MQAGCWHLFCIEAIFRLLSWMEWFRILSGVARQLGLLLRLPLHLISAFLGFLRAFIDCRFRAVFDFLGSALGGFCRRFSRILSGVANVPASRFQTLFGLMGILGSRLRLSDEGGRSGGQQQGEAAFE
jgi:hypothetical protein